MFLNAQSVSIKGVSSLFSAICSLMFPSFHVFGTKVRQFSRTAKAHLINLSFWREWNLPLAKFLSVENNKPLKDLRTVWMIGFQEMIYYLCCSLFLLFRQSFISIAGCRFKPNRWIGKGFGAVYSPTEEESSCKWEQSQVYLSYAECSRVSVNCSKRVTARPFLIQMRFGYLCIRQKEINDQIYNSSITLR